MKDAAYYKLKKECELARIRHDAILKSADKMITDSSVHLNVVLEKFGAHCNSIGVSACCGKDAGECRCVVFDAAEKN